MFLDARIFVQIKLKHFPPPSTYSEAKGISNYQPGQPPVPQVQSRKINEEGVNAACRYQRDILKNGITFFDFFTGADK